MNCKRQTALLAAVFIAAAGCADRTFDSSTLETAEVRLHVGWDVAAGDGQQNGIVRFSSGKEYSVSSGEVRVESAETGEDRIVLFNLPEGLLRNGSVFTVEKLDGGTIRSDAGLLFCDAVDVHIKPMVTNDITVTPRQTSKRIAVEAESDGPLEAFSTAVEAAGSLDVEYNRFFNPQTAAVPMAEDLDSGGRKWSGSATVLGWCTDAPEMKVSLRRTGGQQEDYVLPIPLQALGYNRRIPPELRISLHFNGGRCAAAIAMPSGNWQINLEKINIDENTENNDIL